jgi:hypothetical protein
MIDAVYTVSQSEFTEAQRIWCSRELKKLPGRVLVQVVSVIFGVFLGMSFGYVPAWLEIALGTSLLVIVLVCQWRKKAIRNYQFSMNADRMEAVHIHIDETGYRDEKTSVCGGWIAWPSFTGWRESTNVFVLGRNLTFITLPKSAIATEQQEELRALLRQHLGSPV